MDEVERVANAILYEGYLLWPYRRSATKNQRRWTFGGVYPRAYSESGYGNDPWFMQTQILVTGEQPILDVRLRFLQIVERRIARVGANGALEFADELRIGANRYLAWDEASEREVAIEAMRLEDAPQRRAIDISIPAGSNEEPISDGDGQAAGVVVRTWRSLSATLEARSEFVQPDIRRLTLVVANTADWTAGSHDDALRCSLVSTHSILRVRDGAFISLLEPPAELRSLAESCQNIKTWPVLAGTPDEARTMLSSPIILYDYPRTATESPGDLFDATEIDELLRLNVLALTDDEREEAMVTDPRAREIIERTSSLSRDGLMLLHGKTSDLGMSQPHPGWPEDLDKAPPKRISVDGAELGPGSRVRLRPRSGGDIMDIALSGKVAVIAGIEQDYEDRILVAVTLEDDPGRDLGEERQIGHRFHFRPDEIEVMDERGA